MHSCLGVGRPGSGALPPPTTHPFGRAAGAHYPLVVGAGSAGVGSRHGPRRARSCKLALPLWGRHEGAPGGRRLPGCGVSRVGRSPTPDHFFSGVHPGPTTHWLWVRGVRAWGPVTNPTGRALASWLCALLGRHEATGGGASCLRVGRPGKGTLPAPTSRPFGRASGARFLLAVGAVCGPGGPAVLGIFSRAGVRRVLCVLPGFAAPSGRCGLAPVLVPWLWPAACLSDVPRGPALVRRASSGPVALGAPVGFPVAVVPFRNPAAVAPGFTGWLRGARAGRPRTGLFVPTAGPCQGRGAGRAPRCTRSGPRDAVVPGGSLRLRSWAACAAVVWRVWTRSLTRPVSRTVRLSTGDSAGAPGLFRVDADTFPFGSEDATPGSCACARVRAFFAGSAGWPPRRVLMRLTFSSGRSWCPLCLLGPLRAGVTLLVVFLAFFPSHAPAVSCVWCLPALGALGLGVLCPPPPSSGVFFSLFCAHLVSGVPCFPALGALGLGVLSPPPSWWFFFVFFLFLFCVPLVSGVPCFSALGALGLGILCPPPSLVFFLFFSRAVVCRLCGAAVVCPGLSGVSVCVAVGLVLRWGPVCACALSFGAPCLWLLLLCCCLLCCACPLGPCCLSCLPVVPPPPPPAGCGVLCCASSCPVSCGAAACGAFCVVPGRVWGACVGLGSCAVLFGAVWCRAVLCFFCPALLSCVAAFSVGSGLRAGSRLFLFLCSAFAVLCWCACVVALCAVLSCPCGAGWCSELVPVVFACLLLGLVVLCCLLVGPGGSWCLVSVVCCGVSLGAVLRRVAARCVARRCVVVRCVVFFCSVWCCRALCCVLGRCPSSWGPVPSGAVFCLVPLRCVCFAMVCCCVVLFAVVLCGVCALGCRAVRFLPSPPCAVLLCGPLSSGALLPCAVPRGALLPRGAVVSCPAALLGLFVALVWFYLLEKPLQNLLKYVFLASENKIKLYTTQHTPMQQDHVRFSVLDATRHS